MDFQDQVRSLSRRQRERFKQLNSEVRRSLRVYSRVSGDSLAPFTTKNADPYGIPLPDADSYDFKIPNIQRNRFIGRDELDFGVIRNLEQTDVLRFSPGLSYQVERGSGDRTGYLISQYTTDGTDLLAVVVGENPKLRSLSQSSGPLGAADFLN